jgi:hypothetical protein
MLMRARGDLLVARFWSSKDGKGRAKYPMAVVVQARGVGLEWALNTVLPELDVLLGRCEGAGAAAQVVAALDSTRDSLRAKAVSGASGVEATVPAGFMKRLAERPEMGPNRQGLGRVLYQLQREMGPMVRGAGGPAGNGGAHTCC